MNVSFTEVILVTQAAIMGYAAYIAYKTIVASRHTSKQQRTIELMLVNPESGEFSDIFTLLRTNTSGTEKFGFKIARESSEAKGIRKILNYYENLAIGIVHNIYDERIIYDTKKSTIKSVWAECQPFVFKMRKEYNNKDLYINLENLVKHFESSFESEQNDNHFD